MTNGRKLSELKTNDIINNRFLDPYNTFNL